MTNRIIIIIIVSTCLFVLIFFNTAKTDNNTERPLVRLSSAKAFITSPVIMALHLDYFEDEGIDVELSGEFNNGKEALTHMLNGGSDISTVATTPVAIESLNRNDFSLFLTFTTTYDGVKVITDSSNGIKEPWDLIGKKVGIIKGTISELLVDSLVTYNKILSSDVTYVPLKIEEIITEFKTNRIDAVSVWEPYANNVLRTLEENGITVPSSEVYRIAINLAVMNKFAKDNPDSVIKFTRAISRAVDYMNENPEKSKFILSEELSMDIALIDILWNETNFNISLDQLLLITLENEVNWYNNNDFFNHKNVPNFLKFMYFDALENVNPEAITITRVVK